MCGSGSRCTAASIRSTWRPPRRSPSPRCPTDAGPAEADWAGAAPQPPGRDDPVTDEPDPAGTDRDRRARLRVVGDDRDDVRDEDRDEDKARADDPSPEDSS